ncbi:MAG TPA: GNVR domain-containing protein [Candidatus Angelobacter sp.]
MNTDEGMLGFRDYLAIARHRVALIVLTAMAVTLVVVIVVKRMPNIYRAETMILVDPQQVPNNYVASTVSTNISDRLSTIQQEVTSPSRIKRLIDAMHLYGDAQGKRSEQEIIAAMQHAITVQVVEQGGRGLSAFKVGYSGRDPQQVADVANQLAAIFISENLKARERQSYGTAEFLDDELKRTKEQLTLKQTELNDVKSKYMLDLPDSKQYHLEALTTLRSQLQASEDRVRGAQQQKVYLQSMMATQSPTVDLDSGAAESFYTPQIQKLEAQMSALKARYGDKHPDVRKLEAEMRDLENKRKAALQDGSIQAPPVIREAASNKRKSTSNPILAMQLEKLDQEVEKDKTEQQALQQQIAFHTSKLEKIPVFEQRISGMMWDYDSLRAHYSELESKKLSADMASALETHEKGEKFVVLDRAVVPSHPYSPKRALISLVGLLAGLFVGLGLAVALEMSKGSIYTRSEVQGLLDGVPILADIPSIRTSREVMMLRLRMGGAFLGAAAASVLVGLTISYIAFR